MSSTSSPCQPEDKKGKGKKKNPVLNEEGFYGINQSNPIDSLGVFLFETVIKGAWAPVLLFGMNPIGSVGTVLFLFKKKEHHSTIKIFFSLLQVPWLLAMLSPFFSYDAFSTLPLLFNPLQISLWIRLKLEPHNQSVCQLMVDKKVLFFQRVTWQVQHAGMPSGHLCLHQIIVEKPQTRQEWVLKCVDCFRHDQWGHVRSIYKRQEWFNENNLLTWIVSRECVTSSW